MGYTVLFFGLPLLGIAAFLALRARMTALAIPAPPVVPYFLLFAAYGTLLLFAVSGAFGAWSALHSLALLLLLVGGTPVLLWQGLRLRRAVTAETHTGHHRAAAALSLAFPVVFGGFVGLAIVLGP